MGSLIFPLSASDFQAFSAVYCCSGIMILLCKVRNLLVCSPVQDLWNLDPLFLHKSDISHSGSQLTHNVNVTFAKGPKMVRSDLTF